MSGVPSITEKDLRRAQLEGGMNLMMEMIRQASQGLLDYPATHPDQDALIKTMENALQRYKDQLQEYRGV